jgi:hypothetical protein
MEERATTRLTGLTLAGIYFVVMALAVATMG